MGTRAGDVVVVLAEEDVEVRIAVEVKLVVEVKFVVEVEVDDCGDEKHSIRPSGYMKGLSGQNYPDTAKSLSPSAFT